MARSLAADFLEASQRDSILAAFGMVADPWQEALIMSKHDMLVCCARQVGKSTAVAAIAAHQFCFDVGSLTAIVAPSERQASELLRKVRAMLRAAVPQMVYVGDGKTGIENTMGSRVMALPGTGDSTRGLSPSLLVFEEAAHQTDEVFAALEPSVAVSKGRTVMISTPAGKVGHFYDVWADTEDRLARGETPDYELIRADYTQCSRYKPGFIEAKRRTMTEYAFAQEYLAQFTAADQAVFNPFSIDRAFAETGAPVAFIEGGIE